MNRVEYNYRPEPEIVSGDTTSAEVPGLSCFLRDGGWTSRGQAGHRRGGVRPLRAARPATVMPTVLPVPPGRGPGSVVEGASAWPR
jgi:hypothetical protein